LPWPAIIAARLAVRFDLPVPPRNECTEIILATGYLLDSIDNQTVVQLAYTYRAVFN
jgi:hypothetical protein